MNQWNLLRDRSFGPVFWTQFTGALNDNVLKNALVILIQYRAAFVFGLAPAEMVALSGGIFILPYFLFSATAGQLADAMEKAKLMRLIKWTEIGIMVLASVGFFTSHVEFLLGCLFLMGLHSTFFGPLKYSILPQVLKPSDLLTGNAMVESGTFLAILLGTIAGAQLIALPERAAFWTSATLLFVAVAGLIASYRIPSTPVGDPALRVRWNPVPPTVRTLREISRDSTIWHTVLGSSWFWFFGAAMLSLFPAYCHDSLGTSESGATLMLATFSLGIGFGSWLCDRLSGHRVELGIVPFGSIGMTIFAVDLWAAPLPAPHAAPLGAAEFLADPASWRILIDLVGLSASGGLFIVPLYALLQDRAGLERRSRTIAANNVVNAFFMVVSAAFIAGMHKAKISIPQMFAVLGAMNAAVAAYIYLLVPEFFIRFVAWIVARLIYSLRVEGQDRIPDAGACVLVCNHVSFVDWLVIFAAIRRPTRFVMHESFLKKGFIGLVMRHAGVIPIASAKENPERLERAFAAIRRELNDGQIVCLFPEGAITRDGTLAEFRPGVEKIVRETPVPVVPMALRGLWESVFSRNPEAKRKRRFPWLLWMPVELAIGEAVAPERVTAEGLRAQVAELLGDGRVRAETAS